MRRFGLAVLTLAPVLSLIGMTGSATAYPVQYCAAGPDRLRDSAVGLSHG